MEVITEARPSLCARQKFPVFLIREFASKVSPHLNNLTRCWVRKRGFRKIPCKIACYQGIHSTPLLVVNFLEEIILPRRGFRLERADLSHEVGIFHGAFWCQRPAHLWPGDDLRHHLER